jgi:endonuclease-3
MRKKEEEKRKKVFNILKNRFPNPGAMEIGNPYQNLVAVILSARTRDEQVLKLLPEFFRQFPTAEHLAKATPKHIERKISSIGMFRMKAKNLQNMATEVVKKFGGKIPSTMDGLVSLSGVGRKTASVILVASFNTPAIAVDTHVHRVTNRLGWVKTNTPEKTEQALLKIVPLKLQPTVNRVFVKLGRYICLPGEPRCYLCPIQNDCQFKNKQLIAPKNVQGIQEDMELREKILEQLRKQATQIDVTL